MSFLGEIRRRKVFQVSAVYLVVAWMIMQVVDVVNEPLNLPDWFDTVVILFLGIGFPIAMIIGWAFELTPQGLRREAPTASDVESQDRRPASSSALLRYTVWFVATVALAGSSF